MALSEGSGDSLVGSILASHEEVPGSIPGGCPTNEMSTINSPKTLFIIRRDVRKIVSETSNLANTKLESTVKHKGP